MHHSQPTSDRFVPVPGAAGKRLLVLGSRGFVGAHLSEAAVAAGFELIAAGHREAPGILACDLLEPDSIAACLAAAAPDAIVNLAGSASVAASWRDPGAAFAANALGALNLLEAVAEQRPGAHLTCVSSGEVYGEPRDEADLPFREERATAPVSPYGVSKEAMEALSGFYERSRGLRVALVRLFNQFGPGQSGTFAGPGFARQIALAEAEGREAVEVRVGNIDARRDFTDVRDTARAFAAISARQPTGVFNLCSGRAGSLRGLIDAMAEETPLAVGLVVDEELRRPTDQALVYGDPSKLAEEIGWQPQIPLRQTVADLLGWWRAELAGTR
jgi:GDP-4-dehydro-6-deoxy-D-mannose reductase